MAVLHNFSRIFVTSWLNLLHFFQALKTLPFASSSSLIRSNVKVSIPKCFICQKWKECHKTEAKNIPHAKSLILARKVIYCLHINWGGLWCPVKLWPRNTITFHAVRQRHQEDREEDQCKCSSSSIAKRKEKRAMRHRIFYLGLLHRGPSKMHWRWSTSSFLFLQNSSGGSEEERTKERWCWILLLHRPSKAKPKNQAAALLSKSISVGVTCVLLGNHPRL